MSIEYSEADALKIIQQVGLYAFPTGPGELARALTKTTEGLIATLQLAPFPDRPKVNGRLERMKKPLYDFTRYVEVNAFTSDPSMADQILSPWSRIMETFENYPRYKHPTDLDRRMRVLSQHANKLYQEITDIQIFLRFEAGPPDGEGLAARKAAVHKFVDGLIHSAPSIFTEKLTVINDRLITGKDVRGPAISFLTSSLQCLQAKLSASGLGHLAGDPALKISINTLSDWFYDYKPNQ